MVITPDVVEAYKSIITCPKDYGLDFQPISEIFEEVEYATAQDILYKQYLEKIDRTESQIPKILFYIIMSEIYHMKKTLDGKIGYCVGLSNK